MYALNNLFMFHFVFWTHYKNLRNLDVIIRWYYSAYQLAILIRI